MRRDDAWLVDMLLAARDAMAFAAQLTFSEFEDDRLYQLAILKSVEIIGEAASRVSEETEAKNPGIPWSEIIGMRTTVLTDAFVPSVAFLIGKRAPVVKTV